MQSILQPIFDGLGAPPTLPNGRALFAVAPVAGHPTCFVGRANDGKACILIAAAGTARLQQAPIRLECLEVLFELPSFIRTAGQTTEGTFTVIRCRAGEREITSYFLSVCETIIRILGERPDRAAIANAVNRIAYIFRKLQSPPSKPLNGLFGELFVLAQSAEPLRAIAAWRLSDVSRFDFSTGDVRLDVKTAAGRVRAHTFSYDQCNPPAGTVAIAVSMFVERTAGGISLRDLIGTVESRISADPDLVIKLHDIVAATLGTALQESLLHDLTVGSRNHRSLSSI